MFLFKDNLMSDEDTLPSEFFGVVCQRFGSVAERYEQEDIASCVVGSKPTGVLA